MSNKSKDAKIKKTECLICNKNKQDYLIVSLPCCKKKICKCCINKIKKSDFNYRCPHCRQSSEVFKCKEDEDEEEIYIQALEEENYRLY